MSKELLISNITTMINESKNNIRKKQLLKILIVFMIQFMILRKNH